VQDAIPTAIKSHLFTEDFIHYFDFLLNLSFKWSCRSEQRGAMIDFTYFRMKTFSECHRSVEALRNPSIGWSCTGFWAFGSRICYKIDLNLLCHHRHRGQIRLIATAGAELVGLTC